MTYKITVHNRYEGEPDLKLEFDTNSVLLHEADIDAKMEVFSVRYNKGLNPFKSPDFSKITFRPCTK